MTISIEEMRERLEAIEALPTLPIVVQQIQKLIANGNATMSQIATVVARDQATSARVIRLINSAFYGVRSRVTSIQQAIIMLGLNTVKNLVTGIAVVRAFEQNNQPSLFDREKFWLHTFGCAMGAKALAVRIRRGEPEDFFLAGLLHDLGILILDQYFHREFVEVLQACVARRIPYIEAERAVLGITHCEAGEFLARRWKMPEVLIDTIRLHHAPLSGNGDNAADRTVIAAVHVSNVTANNAGIHMGIRSGEQGYFPGALRSLEITVDEIGRASCRERVCHCV